jgi:hypothetical protein
MIWSPLGFPMIQTLPPKVTFTLEFFVDAVFHISSPPGQPVILVDG